MNRDDMNPQENKHQQPDSPFLRHVASMNQSASQNIPAPEAPKASETAPSQASQQESISFEGYASYPSFQADVSQSSSPQSDIRQSDSRQNDSQQSSLQQSVSQQSVSQQSVSQQSVSQQSVSQQSVSYSDYRYGEQPEKSASESPAPAEASSVQQASTENAAQPTQKEAPVQQPVSYSSFSYESRPAAASSGSSSSRSKKPPKKKSILPIILWIIALIAVVLAILPMLNLGSKNEPTTVPSITTMASLIETTTTTTATETTTAAEPTAEPTPSATPIAFTQENMLPEMWELYSQNSDTVGCITLYGQLELPVMYTPNDKEYYLHRNFNKESETGGTLFIDYRCACYPRSTNLIIYGHNMKDGSMFNTLQYYLSEDFCKDYPTFTYKTLFEEETYEVFAAFRSRVYNVDDDVFKFYKFYNAENEAEFNDFVTNCKALSLYDTGVTPQFGDDIMTLVTCEYTQDNGRFVVVGHKITPAQ